MLGINLATVRDCPIALKISFRLLVGVEAEMQELSPPFVV